MAVSSHAWDKTYEAVNRQLTAMGADLFEIGALQRSDGDKSQFMLLRTWDQKRIIESLPWLRYQNWHESHIYVRPKGESSLTLIDDLNLSAIVRLRRQGFRPAVVVQTSPGNYQAWIKHPARLDRELGTAVARELATLFGGDVKAADWRHFGRLAGFRNTKSGYRKVVRCQSSIRGVARIFIETWKADGSTAMETCTRISGCESCMPTSRREPDSRSCD
jgi:hypothetical protein